MGQLREGNNTQDGSLCESLVHHYELGAPQECLHSGEYLDDDWPLIEAYLLYDPTMKGYGRSTS